MSVKRNDIEIIAAPSILGLTLSGVQDLADSLLAAGLAQRLQVRHPVRHVETLNALYNEVRDTATHCLNPQLIRDFSITLGNVIISVIKEGRFPMVLGGDCSILIGIMSALKRSGSYGLIFLDAHADFYEPERSSTGEVADMDLAIVTGRGPAILTNIDDLQPYVKDENVVHLGQRDIEETVKFGSRDIRKSNIRCFSMVEINDRGIEQVMAEALPYILELSVESCWIHFDTDVLADEINPAVDYRLPGGLSFAQVEYVLRNIFQAVSIAGISVTCFNPRLAPDKSIARNIVESIGSVFDK
ncbi:arginase family protein [Longitalea luteola]|uniref:arginase family protein n=1 Tax=Longitalea luteola TaxID=2812563 RepID=UPI001A967AA8|nr:arginase family protein [Longitalea luteola]